VSRQDCRDGTADVETWPPSPHVTRHRNVATVAVTRHRNVATVAV